MFQMQRSPGINENNKTWILVANRSHARFFASDGIVKNLHLVESVPHPAGRLKNHELTSDRSGTSKSEHGADYGVHGLVNKGAPVQQITRQFAKAIGAKLNRARASNAFVKLILIADSKLLGEIRTHLDSPTTECVNVSLGKDLTHLTENSLQDRLHELLVFK
jgi:protein required for attachment to host cells